MSLLTILQRIFLVQNNQTDRCRILVLHNATGGATGDANKSPSYDCNKCKILFLAVLLKEIKIQIKWCTWMSVLPQWHGCLTVDWFLSSFVRLTGFLSYFVQMTDFCPFLSSWLIFVQFIGKHGVAWYRTARTSRLSTHKRLINKATLWRVCIGKDRDWSLSCLQLTMILKHWPISDRQQVHPLWPFINAQIERWNRLIVIQHQHFCVHKTRALVTREHRDVDSLVEGTDERTGRKKKWSIWQTDVACLADASQVVARRLGLTDGPCRQIQELVAVAWHHRVEFGNACLRPVLADHRQHLSKHVRPAPMEQGLWKKYACKCI